MRDRLIAELLGRVARYDEQGDDSALFADDALEDASRLRELMLYDGPSGKQVLSVPALQTLICFHGARHRARPGGNAYTDFGLMLRLTAFHARLLPDQVPEDFPKALVAIRIRVDEVRARALQLFHAYRSSGDPELLDQAVHQLRCAVNLATEGDDLRGLTLTQLSAALDTRYHATNRREDLDEAIETRAASIASTDRGHPELDLRLHKLCRMLVIRHELTGDRRDLERAVDAARQSVAAARPGTPARPRRTALLASALGRLASVPDSGAELAEAVALVREAVGSADFSAADSLVDVADVAWKLCERYDREHDAADLDLSVELLCDVLDSASGDALARVRSELGKVLFSRHQRTGDLADLDRAVELAGLAAAEPTDDGDLRRRRLTNLSLSLRARYERLGSSEDLDEAVRVGTQAVSDAVDDGAALSGLSMAFALRYERTLEAADQEQAVRLATRAVAAFPADRIDANRAAALSHLARVLSTSLWKTFDAAVLDRMIDLTRQAVAACPASHPDHIRLLGDLAHELVTRYRHARRPEDLDEAIRTIESTLAAAPAAHPSRRAHLTILAQALTSRPDAGVEDLDRAAALYRQSVSMAGEDILTARAWRHLGDTLRDRYKRSGDLDDLRKAVNCWRHVADLPAVSITDRVEACADWGVVAAALGDLRSAAEGYDRAVLLLPQLAWHGLPRATREKHLVDMAGLAPAAAACHILTGAPERAVAILEQGRTISQSQLLQTRGDLSLLAERDPALADRLLRVRERLNAQRLPPGRAATEAPGDPLLSSPGPEQQAEGRAALCREWDRLLAEARRLEGFEHFLAPVPYAELSAVADGGPVVVVNVSRIASHALVVRAAEPVEVVALPDVKNTDLVQQAQVFLNVLLTRRRGDQSFLRRERDRHAVHDVLEWLWERIARPVLDHLGFDGRAGEPLPRLWWCPTGLLTLLPLHAAGRHPRHRAAGNHARQGAAQSVPDRVVSSYTSTLTALRRARERAGDGAFRGLLTVGMPETPGRPALPGVERECGGVRAHIPATGGTAGDLIGPKATPGAVREALHRHSWVHFACHAEQDLMDPSQSAFLLYDGQLTAAGLLELHLPSAELAYLSACETATGGVNLPDEVMHLASTLQTAGYRHVVATQWSIQDGSAPDIASRFYSALIRAGRPDADRAARALHEALAEHRAHNPTDPLRWAAFLHVGP
ncbi:CHAT domain-containing protein [Streptomyces sp. NPDC085866]|uniref:CHAT domain-containing protein n=1 Tax=Streptomyces sp. NPDC085866 TaxID=3365736 RepID=UPI0037D1CBB5